MELVEKIIAENHCDEFSTTSRTLSNNPLPLRLTSRHLTDVFSATQKKHLTKRDSLFHAPTKQFPEVNQQEKIPGTSVSNVRYDFMLSLVS